MGFKPEILKKLKDVKKSKIVLTGQVKMVRVNRETQEEELVVNLDGIECVIPKNEVDAEFNFKSFIAFVGTDIPFVIIDIKTNEESVIGSRAEAQRILKPKIMQKLEDGESFDGKIINILDYGAYVDINGVVGLMKNSEFAEDYTLVRDVHRVGNTIKVKMNRFSSNGNLLLEAMKKYVSPNVIKREELEAGQIVFGVVRNIQPWGIYVNIAPNLDALVDSELTDIREDQKVTIRIKSVKQDKDRLKVRGKIINVQ